MNKIRASQENQKNNKKIRKKSAKQKQQLKIKKTNLFLENENFQCFVKLL